MGDAMKPITMSEEDESKIFEKPRGVPQAHEIGRLFAEIDALRARLAAAETALEAADEMRADLVAYRGKPHPADTSSAVTYDTARAAHLALKGGAT